MGMVSPDTRGESLFAGIDLPGLKNEGSGAGMTGIYAGFGLLAILHLIGRQAGETTKRHGRIVCPYRCVSHESNRAREDRRVEVERRVNGPSVAGKLILS